jgi:hypothetical protein
MEKQKILIEKSDKPQKKFRATVGNKKVYFGATGYSDMTQHGDFSRRDRYIQRHEKREEKFWNKNGIFQPSFYSRFITWNQPTLKKSIEDTNKRFNLDIKYKK